VLELQPNIIFQQDGAPPHWSLQIRYLLNRHFPGRWIGRGEKSPGHRAPLISRPWIFSFGHTSRIVSTQTLFQILPHFVHGLHWKNLMLLEYRLVLRATKGGTCRSVVIVNKTLRAVEYVAKIRMSPSHIVHALCFIVTVAGLCGHPVVCG
jgi:hypothetical protein